MNTGTKCCLPTDLNETLKFEFMVFIRQRKGRQKNFTFEMSGPANLCHFCLKNNETNKDDVIIFNRFSSIYPSLLDFKYTFLVNPSQASRRLVDSKKASSLIPPRAIHVSLFHFPNKLISDCITPAGFLFLLIHEYRFIILF